MSYKKFSIKFAVVAVMVMMTLWVVSLTALADGAHVYLKPIDSADGTMSVEVIADNVTNFYGMEFQLKYDPTVLAVQDEISDEDGVQVQPGDFLPVKQGFVVANKVDEANGTITLAVTLLNPAPAVTGNGSLARLTFKVLSGQASSLDIETLNLVSAEMQPIPYQKENLNFGTGSGSGSFLWIALGGVAVVVVLLMVGSGAMMIAQTKSKPTAQKRRPLAPQPQVSLK